MGNDGITIDEIAIQIETQFKGSDDKIQNLVNVIDKLQKKLSSLNGVEKSLDKISNSIQNLSLSGKGIKQTSKNLNDFLSKAKIAGAIAALGNAVKKMGNYVNESNNYIENLNLFYVSMGKMADEAKRFAENFSDVLGVDVSNVMRYIGDFNSLARTFGIASDKAYIMSKNLTQLAYDISSFRNISVEEAMQKLRSGFVGEIEPMRAIGIALDQATLQETAYSLGINKRISTMTRAQKTELLYYQMLTKTTQMQGDMARTLLQPANAIRILKQQFTLLTRAIGNIFIPIVMKVIPYVMALTKVLTRAAQAVANFFGFEIDTSAWKNLEDVSFGIDAIGDSAEGTTKELKKMLAPFDELNVIDFGKDSGGAGVDISGGSLGIPLPEYDALEGALSQNLDKIEKKLEKILPIVGLIGASILTWKIGGKFIDFIDKFKEVGNSKFLTNLKQISGVFLILGGAVVAVKEFFEMWEKRI